MSCRCGCVEAVLAALLGVGFAVEGETVDRFLLTAAAKPSGLLKAVDGVWLNAGGRKEQV